MSFFVQLADFLIIKHAIRSYQKNLQNEYLRNQALLAEREREIRAEEERAEENLAQSENLRKCEENLRRMLEENDKRRRQIALEHEAKLAEHEARIEQLKQMEGDHSAEIKNEEFYADFERDMVRIFKTCRETRAKSVNLVPKLETGSAKL